MLSLIVFLVEEKAPKRNYHVFAVKKCLFTVTLIFLKKVVYYTSLIFI